MEKRKRGGQPGNQNAKGHGAPAGNQNAAGHGAPFGNTNALQHGNYSIYRGYRQNNLYLAAVNFMDRNRISPTRANLEICVGILGDLRTMREGATMKQALDASARRVLRDFLSRVEKEREA